MTPINPTPLPPGRYALAISGGADSTALLHLLKSHPRLSLHLVHLDHQLRNEQSTADANFVRRLAQSLNLPLTLALRSDLEPAMPNLPKNPSAKYRRLRHHLFQQTIQSHHLDGLLLAHHADDQAETILLRLLRNSPPTALAGMSPHSTLHQMKIFRPLLKIRTQQLRAYLLSIHQPWQEDASNQNPKYARNRIRQFLKSNPALVAPLLNLAASMSNLRHWLRQSAPILPPKFPTRALADLPAPLAKESARQWLLSQGLPPTELTHTLLTRLIQMASDHATPPRQQFPNKTLLQRSKGFIQIPPNSSPTPINPAI